MNNDRFDENWIYEHSIKKNLADTFKTSSDLALQVDGFKEYKRVNRAKVDRQTSKKFTAIAISAVLAAGVFSGITAFQEYSHKKAVEPVATLEVVDSIDGDKDLKVEVQRNGEAYVILEDGNRASSYNGMSASDIASLSGYDGDLANQNSLENNGRHM